MCSCSGTPYRHSERCCFGHRLAGCSGASLSMPDWMSFHSSPPPPTALQFESDPPGADVRTAQGQTCLTPCSLTVPPENQSVSFAKNGYLPQTVKVTVRMPEHGMFDNPPPDIQPNPVAGGAAAGPAAASDGAQAEAASDRRPGQRAATPAAQQPAWVAIPAAAPGAALATTPLVAAAPRQDVLDSGLYPAQLLLI